ncbi:MAG TPA: DUF192 domain-containing protein [Acidimicrobiia bacterium]|nr:DUF192 domain-containing protein [Acidimicrobiia bacterium]
MPGPGETTPEGDASPGDLAAGLLRTLWPWLLAGVAVLGFVAFLLWGSGQPDDPEFVDSRTVPTPADGLAFSEVGRLIGDTCLKLLVADDPAERASGLRGREGELDRVDGMLFVGDAPSMGAFTMSEVVAPIEIGFYDAEGTHLGGHDMVPCADSIQKCVTYPPPSPWSFAVETKPGELPDGNLGGECEVPPPT